MKIVYFAHTLQSCWNNGNAHFLRGVLRALAARGHDVVACEPEAGWSIRNLLADHGPQGLEDSREACPDLRCVCFADPERAAAQCQDADLVLVHEWNDPALVARLGQARASGGRFLLLFHDTHHRAVSDPQAIHRFDLQHFDGVLAFGASLAAVYRQWGWGNRVFVWHEAADTALFRPPSEPVERSGLIWVGNFGDGERTQELETFLLRPARDAGLPLDIFGVRYPSDALDMLARYGAAYHGWLANARVPATFARYLATIHVPRRAYADRLAGIPTIRVFEALACGIPLVCAPWSDSEGLFRANVDYLMARDGAEMARHLRALRQDSALRASLARHGLATIAGHHTCGHRADELLTIAGQLAGTRAMMDTAA